MDLDEVSLEKFRLWSPDALRYFLSVRKKSVEGNFDELVARAFAACEDKAPVYAEAEKAERRLFQEYTFKLQQDGQIYPDPATFDDGWLLEEDGLNQWPNIYITDIVEYLGKTSVNKSASVGKLLNEYKDGKAYRYYACEWVKEVKYHPVRPSSPMAFMQAAVHPSMNVRKKPWNVWVMVEKKTPKVPGGTIRTAYCTCPAGLLGSCNHIAALLFRVEAAIRIGANEQACTEELCGWVVPKSSVSRKPGKWRDTFVMKDKYSQKMSRAEKKAAIQKRRDFQPFGGAEGDRLLHPETICQDLKNLFINEVPNSVFILMMDKKKKPTPARPVLPDNPLLCAEQCHSVAELNKALHVDDKAVEVLELYTRQQSQSNDWHDQRVGRITSSSFYNVHTKSQRLQMDDDSDTDSCSWLVKKLMGTSTTMTAAMKHGISLEAKAKACYTYQQKKKHKGLVCRDSGLVVSKIHPFLATSPDLVVNCQCHSTRLCEIKCPFSIKNQIPSVENVSYLRKTDNEITLAKRHQYYGQIQGQLAVMGCTICDLFIFTEHGSLTIEVTFDSEFWNDMVKNLVWFWETKIAPELLKKAQTSRLAKKRQSELDDGVQIVPPKQLCAGCDLLDSPPDPEHQSGPSAASNSKSLVQRGKTKRASAVLLKVYQCGICCRDIFEEPKSFNEISVKCDYCPQWYHQICIGVAEGNEIGEDDKWVCEKCQQEAICD